MQRLEQSWSIGKVKFRLVEGDLFRVSAEAIVNSEQVDFILSRNLNTISGQIQHRFGHLVQDELDEQTQGGILPVGTVLSTGAVPGYARIFHIGFHDPNDFPALDDDQTEYLHIIRTCIRRVLNDAIRFGLKSVAFPLLGTGMFGLDPALLSYEFMGEVIQFASELPHGAELEIRLVVRDEQFVPLVLEGAVQALIDRALPGSGWEHLEIGVPYLDLYERMGARSDHPTWLAWQLCRYCELITGFIFYNLAGATDPPTTPDKCFKSGIPISFGAVQKQAVKLALSLPQKALESPWPAFLTTIVADDNAKARRLERLKSDRNDIAHGRKAREAAMIRADLCDFLQLSRWHELVQSTGLPDLGQLRPWLDVRPANATMALGTSPDYAILDEYDADMWSYVIPYTGNTFQSKRSSSTGR